MVSNDSTYTTEYSDVHSIYICQQPKCMYPPASTFQSISTKIFVRETFWYFIHSWYQWLQKYNWKLDLIFWWHTKMYWRDKRLGMPLFKKKKYRFESYQGQKKLKIPKWNILVSYYNVSVVLKTFLFHLITFLRYTETLLWHRIVIESWFFHFQKSSCGTTKTFLWLITF